MKVSFKSNCSMILWFFFCLQKTFWSANLLFSRKFKRFSYQILKLWPLTQMCFAAVAQISQLRRNLFKIIQREQEWVIRDGFIVVFSMIKGGIGKSVQILWGYTSGSCGQVVCVLLHLLWGLVEKHNVPKTEYLLVIEFTKEYVFSNNLCDF